MGKQWAVIIGAGLAAAMLFVSVEAVSGGPSATVSLGALLFGTLTPLPLFLVGLTMGLLSMAMAAAAALLAVGLVTASVPHLGLFLVLHGLPPLFLVRQALLNRTGPDGAVEWYPAGLLLGWTSAIAAALLLAATAWLMGEPGGLKGLLQEQLQALFAQVLVAPDGKPLSDEQLTQIATGINPFMPAIVVWTPCLFMVINLSLAQTIAVRSGRNNRPWPDVAGLVLPPWVSLAFGAAVLVSFTREPFGFYGGAMAMVFAFAFCLQGLAVIHALARGRTGGIGLVVIAYLLLFIGGVLMMPVLLLIGLLEQWLRLRQRFGLPPDQENE